MLCALSGFFFFQAEDGIRDYKVTGVQTCALPISARKVGWVDPELCHPDICPKPFHQVIAIKLQRSEERRVGKECRARREAKQQKKKQYQAQDASRWIERNDLQPRAHESSADNRRE